MSIFGEKQAEAIDFPKWEAEWRALDAGFQKQIEAIVTQDTEYQRGLAARGGTMTTALTEKAEAVARKVNQARLAAQEAFRRRVRAALTPEHERSATKASEAYRTAGAAMTELLALEENVELFCRRINQPTMCRRIVDETVPGRAMEFASRVEQMKQAAPKLSWWRPAPLTEPDFEALTR